MRWFYMGVTAVFLLVVIIFALQNLEPVSIDFLGFSARAPVAVVIIVIYLVGMATGSSLIALLKKSLAEARRHPDRHPPR